MEYKVGDRVRIKTNLTKYESDQCYVTSAMVGMEGQEHIIEGVDGCKPNYKIFQNDGENYWWFTEDMLEPIKATRFKIGDRVRVLDGSHISNYTGNWNTGMQRFVGNTYTIAQVCNSYPERTAYYLEGHPYVFDERGIEPAPASKCRSGKIPSDLIISQTEMKRTMGKLLKVLEKPSVKFGIKEFEQKLKEGKKMPTIFTFYTEEGYRIDKSNNSKVETITTFVKINGSDNTYLGMATCDKVDYSEREGVINALANAMCNGNFDREFNKAVKANELADKKKRTCKYCGKVFDTVEEREAEEAWHVERKKARRERYLLRKRAKEIAFEEAAQKLAKEMIGEQK